MDQVVIGVIVPEAGVNKFDPVLADADQLDQVFGRRCRAGYASDGEAVERRRKVGCGGHDQSRI